MSSLGGLLKETVAFESGDDLSKIKSEEHLKCIFAVASFLNSLVSPPLDWKLRGTFEIDSKRVLAGAALVNMHRIFLDILLHLDAKKVKPIIYFLNFSI